MTESDIYFNALAYVLFKITSPLRFIYMEIKKREIILFCYYEIEPTEVEKELMEDIRDNIYALIDSDCDVSCQFIVTNEHFDKINKTDYPLFARFEK